MTKAVFLDRDGVINVDVGYTHRIEDLKFEKNAVEGLKILYGNGFKLIIITSQSGVGRGYFSEEDMNKFNKHMLDELEKKGIKVEKIYCCIHKPDDNCDCRKPKTALVEKAIKESGISRQSSFIIGDETRDIMAGENAGIKTVLVETGKAGKDMRYKVKPDFIAKDLYAAAKLIVENES